MENFSEDIEFGNRLLRQFIDLYFMPEITKRQDAGTLPKPLDFRVGQVLFFVDRKEPEVRINSEVKALAKVRAETSKQPGDPVYEREVTSIRELHLTDEDDPDCGHATFLRLGDRWHIFFDFRYNKALSREHIQAAKQFYESAEYSATKGNWRPFVDSLFNAAELCAKAELLFTPDKRFRKNADHKTVKKRYNLWADLGNVKAEFRDTFNKLYALRDRARYLKGKLSISTEEAKQLLKTVNSMIDTTSQESAT